MSLITEKYCLAQLEVFIPPRTNIGPGEGRCTDIREFWTEFCSGRDKKFELDQRFFSVIKHIVVVSFIMKNRVPQLKLTSESQNSVFLL